MAVFRRKGSPFYYAEFQINRRRILRSTGKTTEREALTEERRLRRQALEARQTATRDALTLNQAFERYWQQHGSKLSATWSDEVDRYSARILALVDPAMLVEDVTDAEVNEFVQACGASEVGEYSVNRMLSVWRGMHSFARKRWKQRTHIIDWSDFMFDEEKRVRWITVEEAQRLLAELPVRIALAVEWSLYTGCRKRETFSLRWADVHADRGYATVLAKGGETHTVWLSEQALDVLARCENVGPTSCVFDGTNRRDLWERALKRAGIEDFRWHDLRHTHASWLRKVAPLEVVQRSLGHSKLEMTARYAHVDDPELREALRRVPSIGPSIPKIVRHPAAKSRG